jgi:hypothetical protein
MAHHLVSLLSPCYYYGYPWFLLSESNGVTPPAVNRFRLDPRIQQIIFITDSRNDHAALHRGVKV